MTAGTPVGVIGGTGYVAGEILRLLAGHPELTPVMAASDSQAGTRVTDAFPTLFPRLENLTFETRDTLAAAVAEGALAGVFSAAPHGVSAGMLDAVLEKARPGFRIVDVSADFRYPNADAFAAVYGQPHGAPARIAQFTCAVPEHFPGTPEGHVGHPGCFATAMLLGIVPLAKAGLIDSHVFASGVTGSTGSGRGLKDTTHHPERHSNLFAYKALAHRHAPEVEALASAAAGRDIRLHFVPHSGPFARGIEVTLFGRNIDGATPAELNAALEAAYGTAPFVHVCPAAPRLKDVVGSNQARLSAAADAETWTVSVVIDNLVKGAAGGAVQWMNRLLGLSETAGLDAPAAAWI
jgi:N-acetyl-gamma-glutamyl-phosphate reductase